MKVSPVVSKLYLTEMLSSFSRKGRLFNHINKPSKNKKKNECILW